MTRDTPGHMGRNLRLRCVVLYCQDPVPVRPREEPAVGGPPAEDAGDPQREGVRGRARRALRPAGREEP